MIARGCRIALLLAAWLPAARGLAAYGSCGDATADGVVDLADAVRMLRMSVGLDATDEAAIYRADIAPATVTDEWHGMSTASPGGDGSIGVDDAVLALRASVGLVSLERCAGHGEVWGSSPSATCPDGGLRIELTGHGLIGRSPRAWIGDLEVTITRSWVDRYGLERFEVMTPGLAPGYQPVRMATTRGLALRTRQAFIVVGSACASQPPEPQSVEPAWGVAGSDTLLTITGRRFDCARAVRAVGARGNAIEARDVRPEGSGILRALLPSLGATGEPYDIVVTTDCGEGSLTGWSFRDGVVPDALTLAPSSSLAADGGDTVLLRGAALASVTAMDFGGVELSAGTGHFVANSDSELAVRVPASPAGASVTSPGTITVRRGSAVDPTPLPFTWTEVVPATCTRVAPPYAYLSNPGSIRIQGTLLERIDEVRFGGVPGTGFEQGPSGSDDISVEPPVSLGPGRHAVELVRYGRVEATCAGTFEWRP